MTQDLPAGWTSAPIGSLCTLINGRAFKPTDWKLDGLPIIRIQNLNNPNAPFNRYPGEVDPRHLVSTGELLFAWSGTPGTSFGAHVWKGGSAVLNQHIFRVLYRSDLVHRDYFRLAINWRLDELIAKAHGGAGLAHITKGRFEETEIVLPPLAEQRRIVARIEALFARTRRARADLERVRALADRHGVTSFDQAASGRLTELWRQKHPAQPRANDALLEIRASRQADRTLARRIPSEETPVDSLPPEWAWISPDELAADAPYSIGIGPFGSNLTQADYRPSGVRLVFVRDIRRQAFDAADARHITAEKAAELRPHAIYGGEVLITKMGDPPGDTAVYPNGAGMAVITADCIKVRPHQNLARPDYLAAAIRSNVVAQQISEITKGVAQQKVSLDGFRKLAIPVPPIAEQAEIMRLLEAAATSRRVVVGEVARALALLDRLEQSILAKAFRGELVPQDPSDEPAEALLARLAGGARAPARKPRAQRGQAA